jgi:starch-binding outer membrane protein, SusD/RagB family
MKMLLNKFLNMNALKAAFATAVLIVAASCEVIDLQPQTAFSDITAFDTPERIELAMAGVYDAAQNGDYFGQVRGYPFGAAHIEQGDMRGEDMLNQALFYAVTYEATYSPGTLNNNGQWINLYRTINRANVVEEGVLAAVDRGVIDAATGNAYVGECRFIRALAHLELAVHFCRPYTDGNGSEPGVPYRKIAITSPSRVEEEVSKPRGTVAEMYTAMLEDLDFAETNLPDTRTGRLKITRATKGAAIGLKVRVNMHKADYPAAITEANKIIPQDAAPFSSPIGGYQLEASVDGMWFPRDYSNSESMFSIEHQDIDNNGPNGSLAAMYPPSSINGRGLVRVSPISYNLPQWLATDARRTKLLLQDGRSYYTYKYKDIVGRSDGAPHLRYAEYLLYLAEALVRQNGLNQRALNLLNAVRDRALEGTAPSYALGDFADAKAMVAAILIERRIELLGEGRRWHDIHRLALDPDHSTGGIPGKMTFGNATFDTYEIGKDPATLVIGIPFIPYDDDRFLWPIPADEIAQNPNIDQNPGY